ncbi:hypothetical protein F5880DRAFT_1551663 [Lentinula raphanica]|nr:hypothetical protein F5880DRAFT_1551663 [Lentinula raphanica]
MDPSELKGWELLREYLVDASVTHADVVRRLEELYGSGYNDEIWRPTLNRIMELEPDEDSNNLLDFVNEKIRECSIITHPTPSSSSSIAPVEESPKKRVSVKEYAARKAKRSSAKEQSAIATSSSSALPATATSTLSSSSSFPPAPPVSSSTAETVSTALPSEDLIQSSPGM